MSTPRAARSAKPRLVNRGAAAVIVAASLLAAGCGSRAPGTEATAARPAIPPTGLPGLTTSPTPSSTSLIPDGAWQVQLSAIDLEHEGAQPGVLPAGTYTWTFDGNRARLTIAHDGRVEACSAEASSTAKGVLLTYLMNLGCGGWTDTIAWVINDDGLHLTLVDSSAPREQSAPYLEAKAWQPVAAAPIPSWPTWSIRCEPGCQGPVDGSFISAGFLPGMTLTFGGADAWFNTRDDADEVEFDLDETAVRFWRNPRAASPTGDAIANVPQTQAGLIQWFLKNPNMVVSAPKTVRLGGDLSATTFTMAISESYVNVDPECPADVRSCLDVLWVNEGHVFAIGYGSAERFYVFTLSSGDYIVISVDAPNAATLSRLRPGIDALLTSLRVPGA